MLRIITHANGKKSYMFFNKIRFTFSKHVYWDITNGHGSVWIDVPFVEIKYKKNYKGHSIC
jgi:hypothetical protein